MQTSNDLIVAGDLDQPITRIDLVCEPTTNTFTVYFNGHPLVATGGTITLHLPSVIPSRAGTDAPETRQQPE